MDLSMLHLAVVAKKVKVIITGKKILYVLSEKLRCCVSNRYISQKQKKKTICICLTMEALYDKDTHQWFYIGIGCVKEGDCVTNELI